MNECQLEREERRIVDERLFAIGNWFDLFNDDKYEEVYAGLRTEEKIEEVNRQMKIEGSKGPRKQIMILLQEEKKI